MAEGVGFLAWDGGSEPLEPAPGLQNSLIVTVRWLVATSVTTTLVQLGARSGHQSGSPLFGAAFSSTEREPAPSDARIRRQGFLFPPFGVGGFRALSSSSSGDDEEEVERDGEEGKNGAGLDTDPGLPRFRGPSEPRDGASGLNTGGDDGAGSGGA